MLSSAALRYKRRDRSSRVYLIHLLAMSDDSNNTNAGGRTLGGGASEPLPASWLHPSERPRVGRIGGSGVGGGSGPPDDDDDDEDENQGRESWFAGGERRCQRMNSLDI